MGRKISQAKPLYKSEEERQEAGRKYLAYRAKERLQRKAALEKRHRVSDRPRIVRNRLFLVAEKIAGRLDDDVRDVYATLVVLI